MKNVFILTEKNYKTIMFVYTLPRGQEVFSAAKMLDLAYIDPWYLFLGEQKLWLKVWENLQIFL